MANAKVKEMKERHIISALVENKAGVLARIASLFSARGFNIDSLAVGETEDPDVSRMTIVVRGDERVLEQDYTAGLLGYTWYWVGTQYANGDWLRPKAPHIRSYSISPKADAAVELSTHCT